MQQMPSYKPQSDLIAMSASLICLAHCVALPLFFSTVPLLGWDLLENLWLELATLAVSLIAGGYAILKSYRRYHRNAWLLAGFAAGIATLAISNTAVPEAAEVAGKIAGAGLLIAVHVVNWKMSGCEIPGRNNAGQGAI